jgi:hypothetical protein
MEPVTIQRLQDDIERFGVADAAIAELKAKFAPLQIAGVDDLQGFEEVKRARLQVRKYRTKIEDVRKELKADSLEYGRKIDAEAKRLTGLILEVEGDLQAKESAIEQARLEIAQAAQRALEARRAQRIEEARAAGIEWNGSGFASRYNFTILSQQEIDSLEDGNFFALLQDSAQAMQQAIAAEQAAAQARQEAQRAEQERLQQEREAQAAERAQLEREREAFEAERAELQRLREQAARAQEAPANQPFALQAPACFGTAQPGAAFPWEDEAPAAAPAAEGFPWEVPQPAPAALPAVQGFLQLNARCPSCENTFKVKEYQGEKWDLETCCEHCGQAMRVSMG